MSAAYRSLIVLIVLALCLSLFACTDKKNEKKADKQTEATVEEPLYPELTRDHVQGKWSARVYADELLSSSGLTVEEALNATLSSYGITLEDIGIVPKEDMVLKYVINFEGDKVTQSVEKNGTNDYFEFLNEFYAAVAEYISTPEIFASIYYENGMADLEEAAENAGMTVEEFLVDEIEYVADTMNRTLNEMNSQFPEATFEIKENTLTVRSDIDSVTYNYSGGMLLTDANGLALAFAKE
ncbi:MAG: hypothetical protein E7591_06380 [Ruminococcaceae bacterium]|nr:hypothetical protein [Oscillospiraceae bacterium]